MSGLYDVAGKTAVITGGAGILCGAMAQFLAREGVKVAILDFNEEKGKEVAAGISSLGGDAIAVKVNVLEKASLEKARDMVLKKFGSIDVLINGAGGNHPGATTRKEQMFKQDFLDNFLKGMSFFDLEPEGIQSVFNLNF